MALFKIFKGSDSAKLTDPTVTGYKTPVDGYAYYDTTSKLFYIDAAYDASSPNTITRHPINAAVAGVAGTALNGVFYGTCSTARTTERKDVILIDDTGFSFAAGTMLVVSFLNGSSSDNITMRIGATTYSVDTYGITDIDSDTVIPFLCDGSKWCMLYAGAKTYSSLAAANGGTDESLVTTGEKYIWNSLTTTVPSHTHGNIQNGGTLQTTDVTIATGDKLVITDSSDSSKVARASISFNTANTGKCLTQAGTWADFTHPTTTGVSAAAVKVGKDSNGHVVIGSALTASDIGLDNVENVALSSWTGSTNITTLGTISTGTVPLANISGATDLKAIEALSGTSGLLKKTAADTWTLDTTAYTTNTGTVTSVSAGVGLTGGPVTTTGTIKTNLNSETSLGTLGTTDRLYAIGVDANGKLCVNVPWVGSVIQDNLTSSTNTTDALSAKQGYLLANGSARDSTKLPLAGGTMTGNIEVSSTSNIDLGSSSYPWDNVYANTFNGAMSHYIDIGGKQYNGSADITIYASDLGVSSALNFAGIISETLPNMHDAGYPSISDVHLYSNGSLVTKSSGTVVICHDTQDEFLWSEDASGNAAWYSLGLASSFALHNHTHGNILNNGAMAGTISINNVSTSSASKAIVTDSSSNITIEDLTVSDPSVLNNANATSFISSISQSSTGKITAVKSNISDVYVYNTGDTMTDSLTISKAGECGVIVNNTSKSHQVEFIVGGSGNGGVYDRTNSKYIVYSDVSGNVTLNGNANTATTLATARTINGTSFNGSTNITTANWGTARNISIADSDSTNTGTAVSVNGSAAVTLKLPATIKATLSGNASSATKATQDGSGNVITSTYVKKAGDTLGTTAQLSRVGISKSWYNGRDGAIIRQTSYTGYNAIVSAKTTNGSWEIGPYSNNYLHFVYVPDTSYSGSTNTNTVSTIRMGPTGTIFGAVWNDYAEYRKDNKQEKDIQIPGKCVHEIGDGSLAITTKRLERGCEIISDTFGFAIGQDEENGYNTPIASNGRVLAYPYESIEEFASHIGYPVCSGPDGTVSIMTDEEEEKYPSRIIGTISEIPSYEEWGTGKVKVNGRVWIRIR